MSLSERIRRHLQSHVIAYIALFVALSGTAMALPGKNKVKKNDIARGAVVGKAIAEGAVKKAKLRDAAVTAPKLGAAAVTAAALADGAVTAPKLAEDSVTRQKVVAGAINGGKLANGAVNSAKVSDGTLLGEDFAPGQLSDGFVVEGESGQFTIQRAGRVFVTSTLVSTCPDPCTSGEHAVIIDGGPVATATARDGQQLNLIGLSGNLAAGAHSIALVNTDATAEEVRLGGILLQ